MSYSTIPLSLTHADHAALERWTRGTRTERRLVQRAEVILRAAAGEPTRAIAAALGVRPATVSKWRTRFTHAGVAGLSPVVKKRGNLDIGRWGPARVRWSVSQWARHESRPPPATCTRPSACRLVVGHGGSTSPAAS